jgi:hypothetical protein
LAVTVKDEPNNGATIIERGWIQTWLTDAARQDRALYRFSSSEEDLRIALPEGVSAGFLEVLLDGSRLPAPQLDRSNHLHLRLASSRAPQKHLLELHYRFAERPPIGELSFQAPKFRPGVWVRRLYWQLVLPANEHLLSAPAHFASEYRWTWDKILWRRQPALEQRDLEAWLEVPTSTANASAAGVGEDEIVAREQEIATATNRYLFSTVEAPDSLEVGTASRVKIVFVSSLGLLLTGLVLIYVPRARHAGFLLILAVLALTGSVLAPDVALLLAQASSLGLVLALVAVFLRRRVAVPVPATVPVRGSSMALPDRSATEMYFRSGKAGAHSSTATAPVGAQITGPEAEP